MNGNTVIKFHERQLEFESLNLILHEQLGLMLSDENQENVESQDRLKSHLQALCDRFSAHEEIGQIPNSDTNVVNELVIAEEKQLLNPIDHYATSGTKDATVRYHIGARLQDSAEDGIFFLVGVWSGRVRSY
ncbi:hypothetical protein ABG067_003626 [Albugo candida]